LPLDEDGTTERLLLVDQAEQSFSFRVDEKPVPSLLRGFSAPVELDYAYSDADLARILASDTDGFCRWDAAQRLYTSVVERLMATPDLIDVELGRLAPMIGALLIESEKDPATTALLLTLPAETVIGDRQTVWQPTQVHAACEQLKQGLARVLNSSFWAVARANAGERDYRPQAEDIGKRSLRWRLLGFLASLRDDEIAQE